MVTARVSESLLKSPSLHTKQIRLMLCGEFDSEETELSAPRVTGSEALGADVHVLNEDWITVATDCAPLMFTPTAGFRFHCTEKLPLAKFQRMGTTPLEVALTSFRYEYPALAEKTIAASNASMATFKRLAELDFGRLISPPSPSPALRVAAAASRSRYKLAAPPSRADIDSHQSEIGVAAERRWRRALRPKSRGCENLPASAPRWPSRCCLPRWAAKTKRSLRQ